MSLPSLSQLEQLQNTFYPIPQSTLSLNKNSAKEDEEELEDYITDPELRVQKQLIEELFLDKKDEEEKRPFKDKAADNVTISTEALELYRRQYANMVYENGDERLEIQYERVEYLKVEQTEVQVQEAEPLVIDLNGNGIELTDVHKGNGVEFDITGDGVKEQVSWVAPNDGMLVYDRNGNGVIDSGKELFGDQHGSADGFEELSKFDTDRNRVIDREDDIYSDLNIWRDLNQNGYSETDELKAIEEYGIESIDLDKDDTRTSIAGNRIEGYSEYQTANGNGKVGEVFFNYFA